MILFQLSPLLRYECQHYLRSGE
uniref:Uncharacterized protein n=1 Tax=Anguilla anguilla TaxID=7936 RepID=A0A0E9TLD9_ANGAN